MRKVITLFLSIISLLSFISCAKEIQKIELMDIEPEIELDIHAYSKSFGLDDLLLNQYSNILDNSFEGNHMPCFRFENTNSCGGKGFFVYSSLENKMFKDLYFVGNIARDSILYYPFECEMYLKPHNYRLSPNLVFEFGNYSGRYEYFANIYNPIYENEERELIGTIYLINEAKRTQKQIELIIDSMIIDLV